VRSIWLARIMLLGLAGVLAWPFYMAADILALSPLSREAARAEELRIELVSLQQRTREADEQLARLVSESGAAASDMLTMSSPNIDVTSTAMQENARNIVARVGGIPISSQAAAEALPGGAGKVTILMRARFGELALLTFVRTMEMSTPPMLVEMFELAPVPGGASETPLEFTGTFVGFHSDAL
jgi:hypothetical protein